MKNLTESQRIIKRYYIRPQNIFCSKKEDILKALVSIGDNNCSVYSLKSLEDHDDVHLLKPSDIIYYYDDGILYDKNHVKVMDYDLNVKYEEERKKFADIDAVSDETFDAAYEDRLTEDIEEHNIFNKAIEELCSSEEFHNSLKNWKYINEDDFLSDLLDESPEQFKHTIVALIKDQTIFKVASNFNRVDLADQLKKREREYRVGIRHDKNGYHFRYNGYYFLILTIQNYLNKILGKLTNNTKAKPPVKTIPEIINDATIAATEKFNEDKAAKKLGKKNSYYSNIEKEISKAIRLSKLAKDTQNIEQIKQDASTVMNKSSSYWWNTYKDAIYNMAFYIQYKKLYAEYKKDPATRIEALTIDEIEETKEWALNSIKSIEFKIPTYEWLIDFTDTSESIAAKITAKLDKIRKDFCNRFHIQEKLIIDLKPRKVKTIGTQIFVAARSAVKFNSYNEIENVESNISNYNCWGPIAITTFKEKLNLAECPTGVQKLYTKAKAEAQQHTTVTTTTSDEDKFDLDKDHLNSATFAYTILALFNNNLDFLSLKIENPFELDFEESLDKSNVSLTEKYTIQELDLEIKKSDFPLELGYDFSDAGSVWWFSDGGYYSDTTYAVEFDDGIYRVYYDYNSDDGDVLEGDCFEFDSFEEFVNWLKKADLRNCPVILNENLKENTTSKAICCICGEEIEGYGNNPAPYKEEGKCCDACNTKFVIPARLEQIKKDKE